MRVTQKNGFGDRTVILSVCVTSVFWQKQRKIRFWCMKKIVRYKVRLNLVHFEGKFSPNFFS